MTHFLSSKPLKKSECKEIFYIFFILFSFFLWTISGIFSPDLSFADDQRLADEKIILKTVAGDIILGMYPDVAPEHVAKILSLVRLGVYNGTHFYRVHKDFVAQISNAEDRLQPLSSDQSSKIKPLKAEFSEIPHQRGVLSMARLDDDVNSARTSFSILLGSAPHLDGKYTVFGRVISGFDVLDSFLRVPTSTPHIPIHRITINEALVSTDPLDLLVANRLTADSVDWISKLPASSNPDSSEVASPKDSFASERSLNILLWGIISVLVLNILSSLWYWFFSGTRLPLSLTLLSVSTSYFVLIMVLVPVGQREPLLALGLFTAAIFLFRLLSLFDRPDK
ncbi:MAG TPA: peptidylprolyl isomerase [Oligoflexia bacterium]|nr:peptidylprolyl isomerase [Oligoflexia bacterium]HMP48862.1 peptidylprolyl isomerase [Oligoflexia bacterium]